MGQHLNSVRKHADKIEHFYKHAGANGYSQAEPYWNMMSKQLTSALRSKNDKNDVGEIQVIIQSLKPMMIEMKQKSNMDSSE